MRFGISGLAIAIVLAGCNSSVEDPAEDYFNRVGSDPAAVAAAQRRLAEAEGRRLVQDEEVEAAERRAEGDESAEASDEEQLDPNAPQPTREEISNSQDFDEFAAIETIEGDAEMQARLAETYQTFEAKPLPQRKTGVNLVEYAQDNADRPIGVSRYRRGEPSTDRNICLDYRDQDLAQITFLARGGPRKDIFDLDRDGDGFACNWSPSTYLANYKG